MFKGRAVLTNFKYQLISGFLGTFMFDIVHFPQDNWSHCSWSWTAKLLDRRGVRKAYLVSGYWPELASVLLTCRGISVWYLTTWSFLWVNGSDSTPPAPVRKNNTDRYCIYNKKKQHWQPGTVGNLSRKLPKLTYQKALKLLGLSDVNPAVFLNDFDVLYFIIKSVKSQRHRKSPRRTESVYKCK